MLLIDKNVHHQFEGMFLEEFLLLYVEKNHEVILE
jgi:hypothetical protein